MAEFIVVMCEGAGLRTSILEVVLFYWNFPPFALENFDPRFISCTWRCGWKNSTHEFGEGRHTAIAIAIQLSVVSLYNGSQAKRRQCWYMDPSVRLNKEQWDHFYGGWKKSVFNSREWFQSRNLRLCLNVTKYWDEAAAQKSTQVIQMFPEIQSLISVSVKSLEDFSPPWHCEILSISF